MSVATSRTIADADDRDIIETATIRRLPIYASSLPNRLNAVIMVIQLGAIFSCFWAASRVSSGAGIAALACAFAALMVSVYSILHEAEHGVLFTQRTANVVGGVVAALFFGAPFHLLRQGHIGHHLRNRSDDEAFDLWFDGESPVWKWMQWLGVLTGLFYFTILMGNIVVLLFPFILKRRWFGFDRPSAAFMDALNPQYQLAVKLEACGVLVMHGLIVWLMGIPLMNYVLLYAAFGFLWSGMQYVHHYATERHITRGARNLRIVWFLDKLWLNHNWHRVHHEHPTVSWIHLEKMGKEAGDDRRFLPWVYLRMWSGPRKAATHVENLFAGKIIR
jgi:fatty acid desaturase